MMECGLVWAAQLPLGNVLWESFARSDGFGKGIVLLLLVGSVVAWSIMFNKHGELSKVDKADHRFMQDFSRQGNALELFVHGREYENSPLSRIYRAACVATRREFETQARKQNRVLETIDLGEEHLTAAQIESIRKVAECQAADEMVLLESSMSFLGSIYTVAPMMGLFGTVWGVMAAFAAMGRDGAVNLASVAPGVSSALLTTVIGLVVAIPSALGSNYLNSNLSFLTMQLENFPAKFAARLQQDYLYE